MTESSHDIRIHGEPHHHRRRAEYEMALVALRRAHDYDESIRDDAIHYAEIEVERCRRELLDAILNDYARHLVAWDEVVSLLDKYDFKYHIPHSETDYLATLEAYHQYARIQYSAQGWDNSTDRTGTISTVPGLVFHDTGDLIVPAANIGITVGAQEDFELFPFSHDDNGRIVLNGVHVATD